MNIPDSHLLIYALYQVLGNIYGAQMLSFHLWYSVAVKWLSKMVLDLEAERRGFTSFPLQLNSWATKSPFLVLPFFICKMGIQIPLAITSKGYYEDQLG